MPRYLTHSALVAVRHLTAEALRHRRPRRAARVRAYTRPGVRPAAPLITGPRALPGLPLPELRGRI